MADGDMARAGAADMWLIIAGALLVVLGGFLVALIATRSWLFSVVTGGSLLFLGVFLLTMAVPPPEARGKAGG